jgi:ABC-type phosphate transport system auxiliary subunit
VEEMKTMKKKQSAEIDSQRSTFSKREEKLMKKVKELQCKNQRYTLLIRELRIRNIDIDGIWHEEKLNKKSKEIVDDETQ